MSILSNLRQTLHDKGYDAAECANRVWMITIPGCVGVSTLNNVTAYFCYAKSGDLAISMFESHSHTQDRFIHILKHGSDCMRQPIDGYSYRGIVPKNMHISPARARKGFFEYTWTPPLDRDDGTATEAQRAPSIRVVVRDEDMQKLFYARLSDYGLMPINALNVIKLLRTHMFKNLTSLILVVREGWRLAVTKKTPHYPQPILSNNNVDPKEDAKEMEFLGLKRQTRFSKLCQGIVEQGLLEALERYHQDVRIVFTCVDGYDLPVVLESDSDKEKHQVNVVVRSYELYKALLVSPNAEYAVNVFGERGEQYFSSSDSNLFLQVLKSTEKTARTSNPISTYSRDSFTKLTSGGVKEPTKKVDFSLDTLPFLTSSWLASVAILLIFLEWKALQVFYTTLDMKIISHALIPWQPLNKIVTQPPQERNKL